MVLPKRTPSLLRWTSIHKISVRDPSPLKIHNAIDRAFVDETDVNQSLQSPSTLRRRKSSAAKSLSDAEPNDNDDDFGDDFDEFEEGDEDADFGDFDDGFHQAEAPATAQPMTSQPLVSLPSFVCVVPYLGSLITSMLTLMCFKADIRS